MTTKTKRIAWAYPTSPYADEMRAPDGCYVVEWTNGRGGEIDHKGPFSTKEEAEQFSATLPHAVDPMCLTVFKSPFSA